MLNILKGRNFVWAIIIVLTGAASACHKDKNSDEGDKNALINDWILENMQTYYLWEDKIPAKTDKTLNPDEYFETLLYRAEDRFSWIEENYVDLINSFSGITKEAGYDFNLFRTDEVNVGGYITYVKPNSPAEKADLRRGDFFFTINQTPMTMNNYQTLLGETGKAHTLGVIDTVAEKIVDIPLLVVVYEENPILLDTIYTIDSKKIGYIVYNFFAPDNGSGNKSYEKQLNNIFTEFKSAAIDELVLDLRYNGGGYISTAIVLAGMISNCTVQDLFGYEQYNDILTRYYKEQDPDFYKIYFENLIITHNSRGQAIESVPIVHLDAKRLYVLTSYGTASASELVINSLSPYLNSIVRVGETTYGKNVGSFTIYEEDAVKQQTNKWGMQPIVMKSANKNNFSDYGNGFVPDIEVNELKYDILPLGDTEEPLLQAAIDHILGRPSHLKPKAKRSNIKQSTHLGSAIDRTPARRNMLVSPRKFEKLSK
ncbi:peptidase S41 [Bacteroidia bacterium]|nr:peptidase S41 [Bacteroidia bacterium]